MMTMRKGEPGPAERRQLYYEARDRGLRRVDAAREAGLMEMDHRALHRYERWYQREHVASETVLRKRTK
jgi:hypothetical protein